jgi:hypothetical protein
MELCNSWIRNVRYFRLKRDNASGAFAGLEELHRAICLFTWQQIKELIAPKRQNAVLTKVGTAEV